jgi:DNA-binding MarR family transcriptional regulator
MTPAGIAEALDLSRSSVTALLDRLVRAGYVSRTDEPSDRRGVRVVLQPATFRAFSSVYRPLGQRVHASLRHLPDDERDIVTKGVEAMTDAFNTARPST